MSKKQKFTAQLHWRKGYGDGDKGSFSVFLSDMSEYGYVPVGAMQQCELEIPEDFDPITGQLNVLNKVEQKVRAEFAARITELQRQRSQLLCLENAA